MAVACSGAPRRVNSTARPTRPEWPAIRPSTPAALAAAVRRRAIDWPLMPPSTWAVPSGRESWGEREFGKLMTVTFGEPSYGKKLGGKVVKVRRLAQL